MLVRSILWGGIALALFCAFVFRDYMLTSSRSDTFQTLQVAFVTGGSNAYWHMTVEGAKAAANDYEVDLQIEMPTGSENVDEQMELFLKCSLGRPDGIIISPVDADGFTRPINFVSDKIVVVTFDSDAPLSNRRSYIGTNNLAAGRLCADLVREAIPEGGKVAVLLANHTKDNLAQRKQGFEEQLNRQLVGSGALKDVTYEIVDYFSDEGDEVQSAGNIRAILSSHPELRCIVGMNAYHGPILLQVLEDHDSGDLKLVTFDEAPETLDGIVAGRIYATVTQDPFHYGYQAVRMLSQLCRKGELEMPVVGRGTVTVQPEAIRLEDVEHYRERLLTRRQAITE